MFSFYSGRPIARVVGGEYDGEIIYLKTEDDTKNICCGKCSKKCIKRKCCRDCTRNLEDDSLGKDFELIDGTIQPLMNIDERSVNYIAGPAGSGKSFYSAQLIKLYQKIYPEKELFIFSRTNAKNDPSLAQLKGSQVEIGEKLLDNPIDIEKQLTGGCILLFDDCGTIQNDKLKKIIEKLMADIMEVGRKMGITIIITNHLVIPNEKKFARTVLNEAQMITFFPRSGSSQQIRYALKTYFGLTTKQIDDILALNSRWVTVSKNYPMFVLYDKGGFLL